MKQQHRRLTTSAAWGGLAMALVLSGLAAPAAAQQRSRGLDESYSPLVDYNIFLRERGRRAPSVEPTSRPAPRPRSVEQTLMLTGVVFEDDAVRAYFENLAGGAPVRVALGESVGRGIVTDIAIDAVAYQDVEGHVRWVEIGQDLTGADAVVAPAARPGLTTPAAGTPAAGSAAAGTAAAGDAAAGDTSQGTGGDQAAAGEGGGQDPSTMSTLERLRQNRQRLLNRN